MRFFRFLCYALYILACDRNIPSRSPRSRNTKLVHVFFVCVCVCVGAEKRGLPPSIQEYFLPTRRVHTKNRNTSNSSRYYSTILLLANKTGLCATIIPQQSVARGPSLGPAGAREREKCCVVVCTMNFANLQTPRAIISLSKILDNDAAAEGEMGNRGDNIAVGNLKFVAHSSYAYENVHTAYFTSTTHHPRKRRHRQRCGGCLALHNRQYCAMCDA